MGCHKLARTDRPNIKLLTEKYNKNEPIEWIKVHDLPDYVKFTHKRHVAAGLQCQECHGPVETMEKVQQGAPMQMGWCLSCHTTKGVPTSCNTCHY